jgi:hypothetical protein
MSLSKQEFSNYIKQFHFRELFNDMGWNNDRTKQPIGVDNQTYIIESVAEKSGFKILLCNPLADGLIPDYSIRKKVENKVTKLFQEHLIIYFDAKKTEQIWQLVVRQTGKPTRVTETRYHISQDPELLYQRASGIFFELDEEEKITIVDVTKRVSDNFQQNNEKVTKQFYDKFKKEHTAFLQFIKGIDDKLNQDWYASLMLNRLMFCYFVQKKGFLDNDKNYLRNKLKVCQEKKGKNKFYSFYRNFLLALFHQGLGAPEHSGELKDEIGRIPYLNGGLFDEHELEKIYNSIDIDDKAFEKLFDFFDQYEWHLDTRHAASGNDINPDVIGYIFEKYINDRAQMGAYYTKEDITDYISKNCIIPYLFEETKRQYPKAFNADGEIWGMVKLSKDSYIYDAVKKGVDLTLPEEIEIGVDTSKPNLIERRKNWNKPAPIEYALPTEIWREVVDRRSRYNETKQKISNGEIKDINDFITNNLNIRQFAQDVVENTNDPDFLRFFYKSLCNVTIIDPTCGSGAFLFAALNILEPLYESCIQRMENFIAESDKGKFKFFEEVISQVKSPEHPNLKYFIYKSIILRNLYGVDIMNEAVEIAKLRLFLKLVATVEANYRKPNLGLEPLPDIDFNIRAGNTLVGFAAEIELQKGLMYTLDGAKAKPVIEEKCDIVAKAFARYKEIQLTYGDDYTQFKKSKDELNLRLKELNHELNVLLHKQSLKLNYDDWLKSHQPFHWFAEFYEIIQKKGGFDVVIGNPPYVEYSKIKNTYQLKNYETEKSGNLYAFVIERSQQLLKNDGYFGMIVPLSISCGERMNDLRKCVKTDLNNLQLLNFEIFPSKLFDGAFQRLTIIIGNKNRQIQENRKVTKLHRWYSIERQCLIDKIALTQVTSKEILPLFGKYQSNIHINIIEKLSRNKKSVAHYSKKSKSSFFIYYQEATNYWMKASTQIPFYKKNGKVESPAHGRLIYFEKELIAVSILAQLYSSLFYLWYITYSDGFHLSDMLVKNFPLDSSLMDNKDLIRIGNKLELDVKSNSFLTTRNTQKDKIEIESFRINLSKPILDEIDTVLAKHYGFTEEELDYIINYDIKYRMGKELEGEGDE